MRLASKHSGSPRALAWGILGLIFCLGLVLAPDLLPALVGREGYIWTPINSPLYRVGDGYYYGAWVAEVIRHGFPPGSPSAAEYAGRPLLETLRWFPLAVAAVPSLVISDFRIVFLLDYVFTAGLFFAIPCYLAYRLTGASAGGVMVGVLVLFFGGQWWWNIVGAARPVLELYESETLNSFRYINLSVSGPILFGYATLCHMIYVAQRPSIPAVAALLLLSPFMAFSYPSHALIAYVILAGYSVLAHMRGNRRAAAILFLIGVVTASVLLLGGYVGYVRDTMANNELWNNIFSSESLTLVDRPWWVMVRMALVNRYTVTLSIALWLVWKNRELRDMVLLLGSIGCVLVLTTLFDMPQLAGRFLNRGIDYLWLAAFAIACLWGWRQRLRPWLASRTHSRLARLLEVVVFVSVLAVPAVGFGSYALASANNTTRFMSKERWQVLDWIQTQVPEGDTVAALDWDDITFIPIYTRAYLAVDNMIIGGRGPADELRRYVAVWKVLGFPREQLESRLKGMLEASYSNNNKTREQRLNPPFLEPEVYASSQIAEAVLYWPHVAKVGLIEIGAGGKTSEPLVHWAMKLYDEASAASAVKEYRISWVLLSGAERNLPLKAGIPMALVFRNQTHALYKVTNDPVPGERDDVGAHARSLH